MNWFALKQPIIALAAMDGVSDTVFRQICKKCGADLVFTEFVHSTGLVRSKKYREPLLKYSESERPVVAQIYGNNPEDFYIAAKYVLELGFDGIDINMGCPSKTVAGHGSGCALMRTPELATKIVQAVVNARNEFQITNSQLQVKKDNVYESISHNSSFIINQFPVTVKMRIGYDEIIGPDFAKILQDAGAEALTVHGRTLKMGYSGQANWEVIGQVAKSVSIPVLGNGDVHSADDVKRALDLGCIGVTIGRATFGNPFIFSQIKKDLGLAYNKTLDNLNLKLKLNTYLKHVKLGVAEFGDHALIETRKHISGYVSNFPNASDIRQKLIFAKSINSIKEIIETIDR